jgi:DNA-binding response OmpR family regulator
MSAHVLFIGSERGKGQAVLNALQQSGLAVTIVPDATAAIHAAVRDHYDAWIMSGMLPTADIYNREVPTCGRLGMDRLQHRVWFDGEEIFLTPNEYRILEFLLLNADRIASREEIRAAVWGANSSISNTVDVHMGHLRQKLRTAAGTHLIHTVRGRGYALRDNKAE